MPLFSVAMCPTNPRQFCVSGQHKAVHVHDLRMTINADFMPGKRAREVCCVAPNHLWRNAERDAIVTSAVYSKRGEILASYNDEDIYLFSANVSQGIGPPWEPNTSLVEDEDCLRKQRNREKMRRQLNSNPFKYALSAAVRNFAVKPEMEDVEVSMPSGRQPGDMAAENRGCEEAVEPRAGADDQRSQLEDATSLDDEWSDMDDSGDSYDSEGLDDDDDDDSESEPADGVLLSKDDLDPKDWEIEVGAIVGRYQGHHNNRTIKGVSFLGAEDDWVVSGSDCGHIYIWHTASMKLCGVIRGDRHVVNCLERHPTHLFTMATSGIDDDIKIWAPTAEDEASIGLRESRRMERNAMRRALLGRGESMPPVIFSTRMLEVDDENGFFLASSDDDDPDASP